jgi:hypothetical protein
VPSESSMLPFTERILTLIGSLQLWKNTRSKGNKKKRNKKKERE